MSTTRQDESGVTVEIINKLPDGVRQTEERIALANARQMNFYAGRVGDKLARFIKSSVKKIDRVDVEATNVALQTNDSGKYDGTIDFSVKVLHAGQTKNVPLTIVCKDNNDEMPSADALNAELEKIKSEEDATAENIKASAEQENKVMAELADELLHKEASAGPVAGGTLAPVLHVDKTWLPASIKQNDLVSIDGVRYVITGDDHNKLSAASDGAFWTLRIVDENAAVAAKDAKHMLI